MISNHKIILFNYIVIVYGLQAAEVMLPKSFNIGLVFVRSINYNKIAFGLKKVKTKFNLILTARFFIKN